MSTLYESDFYGWAIEQSEKLKSRNFEELDVENLLEEIESLGKKQRQELINALRKLFMHLLKWDYQPDYRTRSWVDTINHRRIAIQEILEDSPSLKPKLKECCDRAYLHARYDASEETRLALEVFPEERIYSFEEAMTKEITR